MEIIIDDKCLDSMTYRKIFEFIQKEGIEPLVKFVEMGYKINTEHIIQNAIFFDENKITELISQNKMVVEFLKQFGSSSSCKFMAGGFDLFKFRNFILDTSRIISKLPLFIENAKMLEDLRIGNITLMKLNRTFFEEFKTEVYRNETGEITDITKFYTDGQLTYKRDYDHSNYGNNIQEYKTIISVRNDYNRHRLVKPTWIIQSENHANGAQCRYAYIQDFGFDGSNLPKDEELSSYKEPQTLKLFLRQ